MATDESLKTIQKQVEQGGAAKYHAKNTEARKLFARERIRLLIEVKEADASLSGNLAFFQTKARAPLAFQVIRQKDLCVQKGKGLYVIGADRFLSLLP